MNLHRSLLMFLFVLCGTIIAKENTNYNEKTIVTDHLAHSSSHHSENHVDIAKVAFEHILDSHYWHLWGEGHESVAIPLPCIVYSNKRGWMFFLSSEFEHGHKIYKGLKLEENKIIPTGSDITAYVEELEENKISANLSDEKIYDFSITKNVAQLILSALLLILIFTSVAKSYRKYGVNTAPKGLQSVLEPIILFIRDDIARENIPISKADQYVPFLLTVFFIILINNLLGLIPISANVTGNIAFTFTLAFIVLIVVHLRANKYYWKHIFMPPAPVALWPILVPIEIIGIFTKPFALMIRLFANITAGHIIIISLVGLIFIFKSIYVAPISVAFGVFIDMLETFVAFLQAYIFTLLTSLYIGGAIEEHHEEHH
ncbi:MAG: F0F1 ATP synthase subunit A [Bacteroidia bacterium]|nr:F0F1 ATP synthase subunit A [Bacteroidia bacterium]